MNRSHKIRIYPSKEQESILLAAVCTSRFAYNWGLEVWDKWYKDYKDGLIEEKPSPFGLSSRWTQDRPEWAVDAMRNPLDRVFRNLGGAWTNYWKGISDKPTFKKRGKSRDSFYVGNAHASITNGKVRIPKAGWIPLAENLRIIGKIMGYHVSTYGGRWWVSVQVELTDHETTTNDSVVGVDVGLQNPACASDGSMATLPPKSINKLQQRLKRAQRVMARRKFASKNYQKALRKKQRVQQKLNDIRTDISHKFTNHIAKNHGTVVIETLSIESMIEKAPTTAIRRAYGLSLMREIHRQLEYKAQTLIKADKYFPSSRLCSRCGYKAEALPPSTRKYRCKCCSLSIDRDLNAALNLKQIGTGQVLSACGGPPSEPLKQEVSL